MDAFKLLKNLAPQPLKNIVRRGLDGFGWDFWVNKSWSQEGEDIVLRRFFGNKENGFYVDVGAHHPKRFSNTYYFYRLGWSGINIDAMPGSMRLFKRCRPRDISLEVGVATQRGVLDYYVFNEPALNGFSKELSETRNTSDAPYHIKEVIQVQVVPLREIMRQYAGGRKIDFMSVDVEGLDLDVLKSNDWEKYRPKIVLAEVLGKDLDELNQGPVAQYMKSQGYSIFAKLVNTVFFIDKANMEAT